MRFNENWRHIATLLELPKQNELRRMPQFFRAEADYVYKLGGEFYRTVINRIADEISALDEFNYISIDSRISMLYPTWYPCIPGWHCDDFYRPSGGQPDLHAIDGGEAPAIHHMLVVGDVSLTQFLTPCEIPDPPESEYPLYGQYDKYINAQIAETGGNIDLPISVKEGEIIQFTPLDFHRGVPATGEGWRMFFRLTASNHWIPKNEIRTQTQVYITDLSRGW